MFVHDGSFWHKPPGGLYLSGPVGRRLAAVGPLLSAGQHLCKFLNDLLTDLSPAGRGDSSPPLYMIAPPTTPPVLLISPLHTRH